MFLTSHKRINLNLPTSGRELRFIYRVRKNGEKPVTGEQNAFSKEEVVQALERLDYKVISVQRKLLDFKMKPPAAEIVTFVRVSADLLREKLPFNEILQLLTNDIENKYA